MDTIAITGLRVQTHIGIHEFEQRIKQPLFIDIVLPFDVSQVNECLTDTLDYDALCKQVSAFVEGKSFYLIETVANEVAALIKSNFPIEGVEVSVSKPTALANVKDIRVTVKR